MGSSKEIEDNVWSSILTEVRGNANSKNPRNVVVLGPPNSGKTTLVAKLQSQDNPKKTQALNYTYLEIRDDYHEDPTTLSIYTLEGNINHKNLLNFPLNNKTLEKTIVIITASIEQPWELIENLEKWAQLLHDHVDSLEMDSTDLKQLRDSRIKKWLDYDEVFSQNDLIALGEGVLTRNVGLEIIVVVTKTDLISTLEKEEFSDEHFDFIQMHVRKFCLSYGASLFYTSVKEDKNCDLLYKFLTGENGGKWGGIVVEKEAVFVPPGWDNLKKIQILHENLTTINPEAFYNEVIPRPINRKVVANETTEVEDEQRFLERQLLILSQGASGKKATPEGPKRMSPVVTSGTPKKGEQCTDRVLANFFNSLLTSKKSSTPNTSLNGTDC